MLNKRLIVPGMPQVIAADGNSDPINVATANALFLYAAFASVTGGATTPTLALHVDYLDDDESTVLAFQVVTLSFTEVILGVYSNVGPLTGGGGFILPNKIRLRWDIGAAAGSPLWNGMTVRMYQQVGER